MEQLTNQCTESTAALPHWHCCGVYHAWVREVKEQGLTKGIYLTKTAFI